MTTYGLRIRGYKEGEGRRRGGGGEQEELEKTESRLSLWKLWASLEGS